jgi:hypothetical protein
VDVVPVDPRAKAELLRAVEARVRALDGELPGLAVEDRGDRIRVVIPKALRVGHEEHFALLVRAFLEDVESRAAGRGARLPSWERPNMLAKYRVTTEGVAKARRR